MLLLYSIMFCVFHTTCSQHIYSFLPDDSLEIFSQPDLQILDSSTRRKHFLGEKHYAQEVLQGNRANVMNDRLEIRRNTLRAYKKDNREKIKRIDFVEKQDPKIPQNPDFGQCCHWAKQGECTENVYFMRVLCTTACGFDNCNDDEAYDCSASPISGCTPYFNTRLYPYTTGKIYANDCCTRASRGDCWKNYTYMSTHCKQACQDVNCAVYATPWVYDRHK